MAIDYTSAVGQVRLLITDVNESPTEQLFTDPQLQAFLTMAADSVNRAAAKALRTIAASELLVSKVIKTQDVSTDGAKVSAELRALAAELQAEADAAEADDSEFFEFVPFGDTSYNEGEEYRL